LAKHPTEVTLFDILQAAEGPIELTACLQDNFQQCRCLPLCSARSLWKVINREVKSLFQSITMEKMMQMEQEQRFLKEEIYQI